jgi:hypothetical protein
LQKKSARSQKLETWFDDGPLRFQGKPFDREARDHSGQPLVGTREILIDSGRITFDHPYSREFAPQHCSEARLTLYGNDAIRRAAGPHEPARDAAGSGTEFEDRPGPIEFDAPCECVRKAPPARICSRYSHRLLQPKTKKHGRPRVHVISFT